MEYDIVSQEDLKLAWWHVGRFLHSFAILESSANELFEKLFNLNATFFLLLVPQLDLELIRIALGRKAVNVNELIEVVRRLVERVQTLVGGKGDESFISYDAFGHLDGRMKQLTSRLWELAGECISLSDEDFDDETVKSMRDVLSQNVIPLKQNGES